VGDYTVRLSEELLRLGSQAVIIALHDRYVCQSVDLNHASGEGRIRMLRLAADMPWGDRVVAARACLTDFDPEWVSFQFVPYGFNDKGVDWMLGRVLREIVDGRNLHVMFHELWIGAYRGARLKDRLIGMIQRQCVLAMTRRIVPTIVTTSNEPYVGLLRSAGIPSSILPLFGNIPVAKVERSAWLEMEFRNLGLVNDREAHWIFTFFGTLHPIWQPEPLFSYLARAAEQARRKVTVTSIGRLGSGETLWNRLSGEYGRVFQFRNLGEQPSARISEWLATADFGIAASPWELVGKSGTVTSMLEHGLPVIVSRDDVRFGTNGRTEPSSELLIKMDADLSARLLSIRRASPKLMLPKVARLMLSYLCELRTASISNVATRRVC
jgi:glycosyltransferase involved in cell wall biosynthesis